MEVALTREMTAVCFVDRVSGTLQQAMQGSRSWYHRDFFGYYAYRVYGAGLPFLLVALRIRAQ